MKKFLAGWFLLSLIATGVRTTTAQEWQQIVPLKTTRTEVERLLGPSQGAYFGDYLLNDGSLFIE